jgi:hypothetical protein
VRWGGSGQGKNGRHLARNPARARAEAATVTSPEAASATESIRQIPEFPRANQAMESLIWTSKDVEVTTIGLNHLVIDGQLGEGGLFYETP